MGNWHISVRGVGAHHNENYPQDANRMAAEFVEALRAAGHSVMAADFTYGAAENLNTNEMFVETTPGRICRGCSRPDWQVRSEGHLDGCRFAPVATTAGGE